MLDKAVAERIVHDYKVRRQNPLPFLSVFDDVTLTSLWVYLNRTSSSRRLRIV